MGLTRNQAASRAGLWYTVGNILLKGCVFFTLPIFTRILSTGDFGIYNSYIAYENLIQAVLGLGLYGTIKNAKLDFEKEFEKYISAVFSMSIVFFGVSIVIINVLYSNVFYRIGFSRFVLNCLMFQSFGGYFIHFYGTKLNAEFRYKPYLLISVFNTIGSIFLSILLILYVFPNERYLGRIFGSALLPIIISIFVGGEILLRGKKIYDKKMWRYAVSIGLPLVPHVVSQSILSQFDRIMIKDIVGASESGIYSSIYTICTIMYVICLSLDNAWTPWLFYQVHDGKEKEVFDASRKYCELFAILTLGFMCVMPELSKVFLAPDYWSGISLIYPIAISNFCIFMYLMPVSIEYYHKKTSFISIGTFCAAFINLMLNYIAIHLWGYEAAAYTTWISYFLLFVSHSIIAKRFGLLKVVDIAYVSKIAGMLFLFTIILIITSSLQIANVVVRIVGLIFIAIFASKNINFLSRLFRRFRK